MEITTGQAIEFNAQFTVEVEQQPEGRQEGLLPEPVDEAAVVQAAETAAEDARKKITALFGAQDAPAPQAMVFPKAEAAVTAEPKSRFKRLKETVKEDLSLHLRGAQADDINQIVALDMKKFDTVYKEGDQTPEELQAELADKFKDRLDMLGSKWVRVLEQGGEVVGCIMACPTSKSPKSFTSWEDTTDNGTLKTTYDPEGKYLYVVTLASTIGEKGADMLMANMIGKILDGDYHCYFESRVPGFKRWVLNQCRPTKTRISTLTPEQLDAYAQEYFTSEVPVDGKPVPLDPLLRLYKSIGCSFVKIVSGAYQDDRSLNYGVVCQYENPLPKAVRNTPVLRKAAGHAVSLLSHSNQLVQKVF